MLSLEQYQELYSHDIDGVFLKTIHYVSVVNDFDPIEVQNWSPDKLISEYKKIKHKLIVSEKFNKQINIEDATLNLIDYKHIKFGQFIDIEHYINENYLGNLHKIAALLYLQTEGGGIYEEKPESIEHINIDYRSDLITYIPAKEVLGACNAYLKFRANFFESYSSIFQDPLEGVEDLEDMSAEELQIVEEETALAEKNKSNQWHRMLNYLTDYDLTKFDKILGENLFLVFNQYGHIKNKNKEK